MEVTVLDVPPDKEMAQVCRSGNVDRVRELLDYGVKAAGADGAQSFVSIACAHGHVAVVQVLLRAGARLTAPDLVAAARSGSVPTARRVLDELALTGVEHEFWTDERPLLTDPTFLKAATAEMVGFLLDAGADPTERDRFGKTALTAAKAAAAAPDVISLLEARS